MRVKRCGCGMFFALILSFVVLLQAGPGFLLRASAADLSERIQGATGWGTTAISIYGEDLNTIGEIPAKEPFQILQICNEQILQIEYNGTTGYVEKDNVLVNLPDIEPDIIYNLTNATGSIFTSTTESGTANLKLDLFGKQIYYNGDTSLYYDGGAYGGTAANRAGKVWNKKLGRYEFVVPILFTAAEKISAARELAAADGYNFKIYDAYRTNVATKIMNASFNNLYSQYGGALKLGGYDTGFFVAAALSAHNIGCAIDVTLVTGGEEADMPTKMHVLSGDAALLTYASSGRTASQLEGQPYEYYYDNFAGTMTEDAQRLCWYMINSGLTGLGSEWWHYQDQTGYSLNSGFYSSLATWYPCRLYASVDAPKAPKAIVSRAEAAYQLWAAAGFPSAVGDISFTDVTEYDYYYNAVRWAVSAGIFSGSSASTFSPDDAITRAGFLSMVYRCCGPSQEDPGAAVFRDVPENAWYYSAVQWAARQGITEEPSGSFYPAVALTQKQMHTFLTGASRAGMPLSENYL